MVVCIFEYTGDDNDYDYDDYDSRYEIRLDTNTEQYQIVTARAVTSGCGICAAGYVPV